MLKITYLKGIMPVEILNKPSANTVILLQKWTAISDFQKAQEATRKQLNLQDKRLNISLLEGKNLFDDHFFQEQFEGFLVSELPAHSLSKFNISDEWKMQLMLLFCFDAFIELEYFQALIDRKFEFVLGKKNIASRMFDYPQEVGAILIPYHSNKEQLKKWIDEHWGEVEQEMDQVLIESQPYLKIYQNIEIGREIEKFRQEGKKYSQISDELIKKYPKDTRLADEDIVKKIHSRYTNLVKRLQKNLPNLLQP